MAVTPRIVTFTNLFPSARRPAHGRFVFERMRRVADATGFDWVVVNPLPRVPRLLRRATDAALDAEPDREEVMGVAVHRPRYRHFPGMSQNAQARRMASAALDTVAELCRDRVAVIDAHYLYPDGVAALRIAGQLGVACFVTARGTDLNVLAEIPGYAGSSPTRCRHRAGGSRSASRSSAGSRLSAAARSSWRATASTSTASRPATWRPRGPRSGCPRTLRWSRASAD